MTSGRAGKGMGVKGGHQTTGAAGDGFDRDDLETGAHGLNRLQGNDQANRHHEPRVAAGTTDETEGVIESFERMDPKARADADAKRRERSGDQ